MMMSLFILHNVRHILLWLRGILIVRLYIRNMLNVLFIFK